MGLSIAELATMPDIDQFATLEEAENDSRVPYTRYWLRKLCQDGKLDARKFGTGRRAVWLVHMPSLLEYVREMESLGTQKHST